MASEPTIRRRLALDRQQLLILLVAAVMIASFLLLVLWPKHVELSALGTTVLQQRERVNQKVRTSHEGLYVSARIAALRQIHDYLDRRLPPEPRVAEFLDAVSQRVQAESGVTHEIQRTESSLPSLAPAVPLRLRLTGPFDGVYRCLAGIEGLDRMNRFRRVHVRRLDGGRVVCEAEVLVYYLPLEGSVQSADESGKRAGSSAQAVQG